MVDTWDKLYGDGVTPHVMRVGDINDLKWMVDPASIWWLHSKRVGVVVFDESLYTTRAMPIDGHYTYKHPEETANAQGVLRAIGIKVAGYIGVEWRRDAKLTTSDAMREIERHRWDGVYLDNGHLGESEWETLAFFKLLKARGYIVVHHASMEPHWGMVTYRGPWAEYEDYCRQGEQGVRMAHPATLDDPLWYEWISQVLQPDSAIGIFKAGCYRQPSGGDLTVYAESPWYDTSRHSLQPEVYKMLPRLGCTVYITRGYVMQDFEAIYFPEWRELQRQFWTDPSAFRAARAKEFGVR